MITRETNLVDVTSDNFGMSVVKDLKYSTPALPYNDIVEYSVEECPEKDNSIDMLLQEFDLWSVKGASNMVEEFRNAKNHFSKWLKKNHIQRKLKEHTLQTNFTTAIDPIISEHIHIIKNLYPEWLKFANISLEEFHPPYRQNYTH